MGRLSEAINGSRRRNTYLDGNVSFSIESADVDRFLDNLDDDKTRQNIIYKGLISGGKLLQGMTQQYFKSAMGESAYHQSKYIKAPFYEGVTLKGDKAYLEVRVAIMKDFRMKFFEKGTNDRYIKQKGHSDLKRGRYVKDTGKPNFRGRIEAKWFFKDARNASASGVEHATKIEMDYQIMRLQK